MWKLDFCVVTSDTFFNVLFSFRNGLNFVVTQGSEYEFWEENTYNAYENVYRCLAYKNLGSNLVRLVQGIGSDCNGISGELSLDNAFRTLDLQKVSRSESKCDFPLWVRGKTWKVVPRGGIRSLATGNNAQVDNQPRQVSFTDSNSFILGTEVSRFFEQICSRFVALKNRLEKSWFEIVKVASYSLKI